MNTRRIRLVLMTCWLGALSAVGQNTPFDSGSDRHQGVFEPLVSQTVNLPQDGILHHTRVHIPPGVVITFNRNEANTPVYLLASEEVVIEGILSVDGEPGTALRGGRGGPGGFDGGMPGIAAAPPGNGLGPGGGTGASTSASVGRGIYSIAGTGTEARANDGWVNGSRLLVPLHGGSGGGGTSNAGGGGGGGAILIASSARIEIRPGGAVTAYGATGPSRQVNWGSGGAIRLVAPVIAGAGTLAVDGPGSQWNAGRIRCDFIERRDFRLHLSPLAVASVSDAFLVTFPPNLPTLRLVQVAGEAVPANAANDFTITLPVNAPAMQPIVVEATGFGAEVPVEVRLTPSNGGPSRSYRTRLDNTAPGSARVTVSADFIPNTPVTVEAWTR